MHAGKPMARGIAPRAACQGAIAQALTDEPEMLAALHELISAVF